LYVVAGKSNGCCVAQYVAGFIKKGESVTFAIAGLLRPVPLLSAAAFTSVLAAAFCDASAATFKDFREWHAACDNLRNCSAYGFPGADDTTSAWIRIERSGAPAATARITIAADVAENTRVALSFDDPALPGLPAAPLALTPTDDAFDRIVIDDPAAVDMLIASLRKAQALVVHRIDPPGGEKSDPETNRISLSGAVAALLWIDEQQQRLGTVTALIRRGDRPASSMAPPPLAPVVHVARPQPAGAAPAALPPKELRALTAKARELCGEDERTEHQDAYRLSKDASLHSFSCPNMSGAYNYASVFLIVPDARPQAATPAKFANPAGTTARTGGDQTAVSQEIAINASFDQNTMTLHTFNKGRGLGDCGQAEQWVWDGQAFQLVLLRSMPQCKGVNSGDWPVHYRAERK
jgi:hypothetical protein